MFAGDPPVLRRQHQAEAVARRPPAGAGRGRDRMGHAGQQQVPDQVGQREDAAGQGGGGQEIRQPVETEEEGAGADQLRVAAAEKAGSTDLDKVAAVLRSTEFDTVIGKIAFDQKGDVTTPAYVFYKWNDGKYAEVTTN